MLRKPSAQTPSSARSPGSSSANVRRGIEDIPRTASPGFIEEIEDEVNFDNYKLPVAVEVAMNSWIENSNSMAVIMTLFAAVQIILIQVLPSFTSTSTGDSLIDGDSAEDSSPTVSTPLWRSTSFFMYCGIFLHLGGAISAVVIINLASTLPIKGRHIALTEFDSFAHRVFVSKELNKLRKKHKEKGKKNKHGHDHDDEENEDHDDHDDHDEKEQPILIPLDLLENENALLAEWGLGRKFQIAGIHMSICFVLGFLASFISVMLWVWAWEPASAATKIGGALVPVLLLGGLTFCFVLTG